MTSPIRPRLPSVAGILYSSAGFILRSGSYRRNEVPGLPALHDTAGDQRPRRHQTAARAGDAALRDDLRYDDAHRRVLLLAGAFALWRLYQHRVLTVVSALYGAGVLVVGIFPGNTTPHPFVAMIAFVFEALTAIAVFKVTSAPFRFMSLGVGLLSLVALFVGEPRRQQPLCEVDRSRWRRTVGSLADHLVAGVLRRPPPRVEAAHAADEAARLRRTGQRMRRLTRLRWFHQLEPMSGDATACRRAES